MELRARSSTTCKMYLKIHDSYRKVIAVCDKELIGKKFVEGKRQLDVRENFYKGEEIEKEKLLRILEVEKTNDATFNIVGERAVKLALDAGVVTERNVGKVQDVVFALVLL